MKDLGYFFSYLPKTEVNRIVRVIIWIMREAIKNFGNLYLPDFGTFWMIDTVTAVKTNWDTKEKYSTRRMKLTRRLMFKPSVMLHSICCPRNMRYCNILGKRYLFEQFSGMFSSFVNEKKHRIRGKTLVQDALTRTYIPLGYTDEYVNLLLSGEIRDDTIIRNKRLGKKETSVDYLGTDIS